jgi:hypothetical protein
MADWRWPIADGRLTMADWPPEALARANCRRKSEIGNPESEI